MTPKQLERIGRRVWGERWKSPLARAIGMTYQQIQRYMIGVHLTGGHVPRTVELAVMWLDEHPEDARELGALD